MTNADRIIYTIVLALAEADGVDPAELEYTLAEYISPTVLETIVREDNTCELTFRVPGHSVTVTDGGTVFVDGVQYHPESDCLVQIGNRADFPTDFEGSHYRQLIDSLPCTVYQSRNEPGWPIDFISEGCRDITGYDPNAFIVGGLTFGFDLIHPDDRDKVSYRAREAVENDEPFSVTYRIQAGGGSEKWVVENGVPLIDDRSPQRFVGIIFDVTDLRSELDIPSPSTI